MRWSSTLIFAASDAEFLKCQCGSILNYLKDILMANLLFKKAQSLEEKIKMLKVAVFLLIVIGLPVAAAAGFAVQHFIKKSKVYQASEILPPVADLKEIPPSQSGVAHLCTKNYLYEKEPRQSERRMKLKYRVIKADGFAGSYKSILCAIEVEVLALNAEGNVYRADTQMEFFNLEQDLKYNFVSVSENEYKEMLAPVKKHN